jgi:uncharacterized membrane protein YdjX (TVP38/TMEM64 family)
MTWLREFSQIHYVFAAVLFVLARAMAIIIPPIPGAALDLPAVQIFGWQWALVLSEVGTMLGAMVSFGLARWQRNSKIGKLFSRLFKIDKVQEWERRLPPRDQFLAWVAFRLPANAAFDYISYAAGLTNCTPRMFFWSTLIGNIPVVFVFFFLAGVGFQFNSLIGWILPLAFIGVFSLPVFLRLRRKMLPLTPKEPKA